MAGLQLLIAFFGIAYSADGDPGYQLVYRHRHWVLERAVGLPDAESRVLHAKFHYTAGKVPLGAPSPILLVRKETTVTSGRIQFDVWSQGPSQPHDAALVDLRMLVRSPCAEAVQVAVSQNIDAVVIEAPTNLESYGVSAGGIADSVALGVKEFLLQEQALGASAGRELRIQFKTNFDAEVRLDLDAWLFSLEHRAFDSPAGRDLARLVLEHAGRLGQVVTLPASESLDLIAGATRDLPHHALGSWLASLRLTLQEARAQAQVPSLFQLLARARDRFRRISLGTQGRPGRGCSEELAS